MISWEGERKGALGAGLDRVTEVISFCTNDHLVRLVLLGSFFFFFFWAAQCGWISDQGSLGHQATPLFFSKGQTEYHRY